MSQFKFIDLFAGIGGMRSAFTQAGGECVFSSEIDKYAQQTYAANHGDIPKGNIRDFHEKEIPDHDVLIGGFPCFTGGTLVLTISGYKQIRHVQKDELVLTHKGRWRKVTSVMKKHNAPTIKISAPGVPEVTTTHEHPFWARDSKSIYGKGIVFEKPDWVEAGKLSLMHRLSQVLPEIKKDSKTNDFWYIVGRYLADGWRVRRKGRNNGRVVICCAHHEAKFLKKKILKAGYNCTPAIEGSVTKFHITKGDLYEFLEPFGHYAHGKTLPGFALELDKTKSKMLLDGYLGGDGHFFKNKWVANTVSKPLAMGLALLAQRAFGTVSSVCFQKKDRHTVICGREVTQRDYYSVSYYVQNKSSFIEGKYGWKKVKKIKSSGKRTVWNISVDEDESYVADGAVVHNCQSFSSAGVSWSNAHGRPHGFMDKTRGTLFFDVVRILKEKKPKAFLLENVRNLVHHDKGKTFQIIKDNIEELGYHYHWEILDAQCVVPQRRKRIYIIGFRDHWDYEFPELPKTHPKLRTILEPSVDDKYTMSDAGMNCLRNHAARHKAKGNGFSYNIADLDGVSATLLARYYKDGSNILIAQEGKNPRKLTPRECARLMGYPDDFKIPVSDTRAYKQFGNSVVPPLVSVLARSIAEKIAEPIGFSLKPPEST